MEFRIEKRTRAILTGLILLVPTVAAQETLRYDVWHGHSRPPHIKKAGNKGTLTITASGVSFEETYKGGKAPKHPHAWQWKYDDIQQLKVTPKCLTILTYQDNRWKLGADREYEFDVVSSGTFEDAYNMLKNRLDQRFVAALADTPAGILWELPVKHLVPFGGDEGVLQVGTGAIVYKSAKTNLSRTWRYEDIDNISSSGPFNFTLTSFEHARLHYGSRKSFEFVLKQRLEEARYNDLWLRLNQSKGLKVLRFGRWRSGDNIAGFEVAVNAISRRGVFSAASRHVPLTKRAGLGGDSERVTPGAGPSPIS